MNLYLLVVFLKTANNYMDNQFPLSTVTPGFKLFAYLLTGVFCHIVLLRVSWEGFLNLDILNGFKKNTHIMENTILMHGEALLWILESFKGSFKFSNIEVLNMP